MVTLTFWGSANKFSKVDVLFYISTWQRMSIPHSHQYLSLAVIFILDILIDVVCLCDFDLQFPKNWLFWMSFCVVIDYLYIFCEEIFIQILCSLFKFELSFYCRIVKFHYIFRIQVLIRYDLKIFSTAFLILYFI